MHKHTNTKGEQSPLLGTSMELFNRTSRPISSSSSSPYSPHASLVSVREEEAEDIRAIEDGGKTLHKEIWEFVIAYAVHAIRMDSVERHAADIKREDEQNKIVGALEEVGLIASKRESLDHNHYFILVRATEERLEEHAESLGMHLSLKEELKGGSCPFTVEKRNLFKPTSNGSLFTKTQKQYLIYSVITSEKEDGGADLNLEQMQWDGVIEKAYPLHENRVKETLVAEFVKKPLVKVPLESLRVYFGEEIAFYYGWLAFYTNWLWVAAIVGIIAMIIGYSGIKNENKWSNSIYALFISVWVTCFLEFWKRQRNVFAWEWNMLNYEEIEAVRPSFRGEDRLGAYAKKEFIQLEKDEIYGISPPKMMKYFPKDRVKIKMLTGFGIVFLLCCVVVTATLAILLLRIFVYKETSKENNEYASTYASVVGGTMNAVAILILNKLYRYVAMRMTEWENHRTASEFQDNLLFKIFLFQFVNSYTSLYYIAFFKRHASLFGMADTCAGDESSSASSSGENEPLWGWGCPDELFVQLLTILGTNIVVGQAQEVLIPWFLAKAKTWYYQYVTKKSEKELPKYEREFQYSQFEGTFDEYGEMVIQYGYIVLFAASFPLAPLFAVLNNLIEMRSDTWKWLRSYNKPIYRGADDIGGWYTILEVLGVIGVITNCCLIAFSFPTLHVTLKTPYVILCVVVLIEHIVLIAKYLISLAVPDVPSKVRIILAKQYYIQQQILKKYEKRFGLHGNRDNNRKRRPRQSESSSDLNSNNNSNSNIPTTTTTHNNLMDSSDVGGIIVPE